MSEKYVLDIIIRDSPEDFIIISCWGHPAFVKNVQQACAIGNIGWLHFILNEEDITNNHITYFCSNWMLSNIIIKQKIYS